MTHDHRVTDGRDLVDILDAGRWRCGCIHVPVLMELAHEQAVAALLRLRKERA